MVRGDKADVSSMSADRVSTAVATGERPSLVREEAPPQLTKLMASIGARSDAALSQMYDLTASKLYGLARAMLGNEADAEEVVCDVYVQVWQTAQSFDASRGSALAWLMMICRSRALDMLRRRRSRRERDRLELPEHEVSNDAGPEDVLALFQEGTAVHRSLAQLTPLRQELVGMAFFKGLTHQEIAEAMRLPVGTVKSHLRRSLLAMREALEG
jgi:RNA polymerase sigma-70 factor (ECF subfamily)